MKFIKQKFSTILLALIFLFGVISTVNFAMKTEAASQTMGDLSVDYPSSPLFNASNVAPGYEEVKTISVKNNGNIEHSFSIALDGATGSLADVIHFEPRTLLGDVIWNHSLSEIIASPDGFVVFDKIPAGQTAIFNLAAILPENIGNEYQNKSVSTFGIILGQDSSFAYNPPVIPIFGQTDQTSTSNLDGGMVSSSNSRTRNQLTSSNTPGETILGQEGEPLIQQPVANDISSVKEETKGESTQSLTVCYWWAVLLIVLAILLIIYGWIFYKRELMFDWVWPLAAGILIYIIHIVLHRYYAPAKWCNYFGWFELSELLIYYLFYSFIKNRLEDEG